MYKPWSSAIWKESHNPTERGLFLSPWLSNHLTLPVLPVMILLPALDFQGLQLEVWGTWRWMGWDGWDGTGSKGWVKKTKQMGPPINGGEHE